MMIFCLRDLKAACFKNLFCEGSIPEAIRSFDVAVNDLKSIYQRYPDDFSLFHMGSVDFDTGRFTILESPREIAVARTLVRSFPPGGIQETASDGSTRY